MYYDHTGFHVICQTTVIKDILREISRRVIKWKSGQIRSPGIGRNSASQRPPSDGITSAGHRPDRRQDVMSLFLGWDSTWRNHEACGRSIRMVQHTDLDKKTSRKQNPPQGVAPHVHRDAVGDSEHYRWLVSPQPHWAPGYSLHELPWIRRSEIVPEEFSLHIKSPFS